MKTMLIMLICSFSLFVQAQQQMVIGEYQQGIIDSGKVYTTIGSDAGYSTVLVSGLTAIAKGSGAQYTTCYLDSSGGFHILNGGTTTFNSYNLKANNTSIAFTDILGHWRSYFGISEGKVWYLPLLNDELGQTANDTSNKWVELVQPGGGRLPVKMVSGANTDFALSYLIVLYDDGTVWEWRRTTPTQTTTPTQLTWTGGNNNAIDIAQVGGIATVVVTPTGAFSRGYDATVVGGSILTQNSAFEDITSDLAGPVRPWKQIATTYYSLHIRDANDNLWAIGGNRQGVFGNGYQYPSWRTYWYAGNPSPYRFSWANEGYQPMTQIMGAKVSNIVTHNAIAPYIYVQDLAGNWYSSGRNKGAALQNGIRMLVADEANYSEFYNVPAFRNISPRTQAWTVQSAVDTAANRLPIANAGLNQYIDTTATTLYGNGSHQQQPTQSTTVTMSYSWSKISGPSCTITSPSSQITTVTGLTNGTYIFRNTVTSSHGSNYDDVLVQVDLPVENVFDYDTTINTWNAIVHLPDNYYSSTDSFPMIVFFPGLGEVGTDIEDLRANGPHKYIEDGNWNGNVVVDGDTVKFIVVSIQPPSSYPNTSTINTRIQTLLSTFRANKLHLTGLSHGAWCASTYVSDYPNEVTSIVNVQGVQPFNTVDYVTEFTSYVNAGGKYLGIEQVSDFRDISNLINALNSIQSGSGIYVQTNYGGGGHCCWGEFYGDNDAPQNLYNSENIYQYMARMSLNEEEPPGTPAPTPGAIFDACQCFPSNSVLY